MNQKKTVLILFFLSLFSCAGGYLILQADLQASVTGDLLIRLGKGSFYGFGALASTFFLLLFIPLAFNAWKKFAIWFIPAAALLFIVYPFPGPGDLFSPYPEQIYKWVSALYVVISLGIIGRNSLLLKK